MVRYVSINFNPEAIKSSTVTTSPGVLDEGSDEDRETAGNGDGHERVWGLKP